MKQFEIAVVPESSKVLLLHGKHTGIILAYKTLSFCINVIIIFPLVELAWLLYFTCAVVYLVCLG